MSDREAADEGRAAETPSAAGGRTETHTDQTPAATGGESRPASGLAARARDLAGRVGHGIGVAASAVGGGLLGGLLTFLKNLLALATSRQRAQADPAQSYGQQGRPAGSVVGSALRAVGSLVRAVALSLVAGVVAVADRIAEMRREKAGEGADVGGGHAGDQVAQGEGAAKAAPSEAEAREGGGPGRGEVVDVFVNAPGTRCEGVPEACDEPLVVIRYDDGRTEVNTVANVVWNADHPGEPPRGHAMEGLPEKDLQACRNVAALAAQADVTAPEVGEERPREPVGRGGIDPQGPATEAQRSYLASLAGREDVPPEVREEALSEKITAARAHELLDAYAGKVDIPSLEGPGRADEGAGRGREDDAR